MDIGVGILVRGEDPGPEGEHEDRGPSEEPDQRCHTSHHGYPVKGSKPGRGEEGGAWNHGGDRADEELRLDELLVLLQQVDLFVQRGIKPEQLGGDCDDPATGKRQGCGGGEPVGIPPIKPSLDECDISPRFGRDSSVAADRILLLDNAGIGQGIPIDFQAQLDE